MKKFQSLLSITFATSALLLVSCQKTASSLVTSSLELPTSSAASSNPTSSATTSNAPTSTSSALVSSLPLPTGLSQITTAQKTSIDEYPNLSVMETGILKSTGKRKILVVPVTFQNCASFTDTQLKAIASAYNGNPEDSGWQTLRSYYQTSSYGQLDIESTIMSPYVVPLNDYERDQSIADGKNDTSFEGKVYNKTFTVENLADDIVKSLASKVTLSDYDNDSDGLIDGFEMVYIGGREWVNGTDDPTAVWWNFTGVANGSNSASTPIPGIYFWSQLTQLENGYYTPDIDAHTLVHESGHMLGLNDYYSYDYDSNGIQEETPAGNVDMMDCNIGDHNAYSKYTLGWINPKYVDGKSADFSLTLSSFTDTGDCLILRNTTTDPWNQTPYDEYLLLQYYTPTGLNKQDGLEGYPEWSDYGNGGCYKKAGLQVFHVDSRLVNQTTSPSAMAYTDTITSKAMIAADNSRSTSLDVAASKAAGKLTYSCKYRLLEAISATGVDYFNSAKASYGHFADQNILFGLSTYGCGGTTFTMNKMKALFPNGTLFNDGSSLGYSFTVTAQTDSTITLHFTQA